MNKTNPCPCPNCGYELSGATCIEKGKAKLKPKQGDLSVCLGCGIILEFTSELKTKMVSNKDLAELTNQFPETWMLLDRARNLVWEMRIQKGSEEK